MYILKHFYILDAAHFDTKIYLSKPIKTLAYNDC